jgi:hypothetical protein
MLISVTYNKLNTRSKRRTIIIIASAGLPTITLIILHLEKVIDLFANGIFMGLFSLLAATTVFFSISLLKSGFYYWMKEYPAWGPIFTRFFGLIELVCILAMFGGLILAVVSALGF